MPWLPLVALLGLFASLLEGAGVGLLIPLVALLLADTMPEGIPAPIRAFAESTSALDPQTRILAIGAAVLALIMLKGLTQAANNALIANLDGRIGRDIRNALSRRLLEVDYAFFLRHEAARLVQIISTDSWYASEAVRSVLTIIPAATALFVFGILLAWLDWRLFAIVVLGAVLIQAVLSLVERQQHRLGQAVTTSNHLLGERMLAVVNAIRAIRVFGQQEHEQNRFAAASEGVRRSLYASQRITAAIAPLVEVLITGLFVAILLAAVWMGRSIPAVTAFLVLLSRGQPHAHAIGRARSDLAAVRASLAEVEWLLRQKPATQSLPSREPAGPLDSPIRFENVSFAYPDGSSALEKVSLTIRPGVATALIGKSGSGKSTIVNLLCRLVEPQAGAIYLGDRPITAFDPEDWRSRIAIAGQEIHLLDGTVAENIAYGRPGAAREEIEEVARIAGADAFIRQLPNGYDTRLALEGLNLSGGQRQRIGLARALLRRPDLLILDEATSAVDAVTETEIMTLLAEHRHFHTALVISHRRSTLAACQEGIVIDGGRIVEARPLGELAYYREMSGEEAMLDG